MTLTEGVVDLINHRGECAIGAIAEEYAQRIETIGQRSRHAQKANAPAGEIDRGLGEKAFNLNAERSVRSIAMVRVIKAKETRPVVR
jgi:hypothetical protein